MLARARLSVLILCSARFFFSWQRRGYRSDTDSLVVLLPARFTSHEPKAQQI